MTKRTRAFLVLGAESSGTRLMTRILIAGGCKGSAEMIQPFDRLIPPADTTDAPIVWRRSVPHAKQWPDIPSMTTRLIKLGYDPVAVIINRDWWATVQSQVAAGHVKTEAEGWANVEKAYQGIGFHLINFVEFKVVSYESLTQRPEAVLEWLPIMLDLPNKTITLNIYDGNDKWLT